MSTIILRWFNGEQEKNEFEIVGSSSEEQDIFIVFQQYLKNNKIEYVENMPYKDGLFCVRSGEQFTVIYIRAVEDWEMKDEPAPLYNTYVCSLKFLKYDTSDEKETHGDKIIL